MHRPFGFILHGRPFIANIAGSKFIGAFSTALVQAPAASIMSNVPGSTHEVAAGELLPMLHAIQDELGYVPPDRVPAIAAALNLSRAEVHGVLSYYHFFRDQAPGRHVVQVCRAEACQACGGDELLAHVERRLGCKAGTTRSDGAVTVEDVYCLGLCASAPAIQVGERLHARVSAERFDRIAQALEWLELPR